MHKKSSFLEINKHCNQQIKAAIKREQTKAHFQFAEREQARNEVSIKHTTMEATNISIKQQSSVSINFETLQAIKQCVLSAVAKFSIFNSQFSIWHIYRQELRLVRAVAAWCDRHNALMNWLMVIQVMTFAFYVFMYA